jgi:hypothetical protein
MSKLILESYLNPRFDTLPHKVPVLNQVKLADIAHMYAWCSVNTQKWNLYVTPSNDKMFEVTFAFDDEMDALVFKLTWAYR